LEHAVLSKCEYLVPEDLTKCIEGRKLFQQQCRKFCPKEEVKGGHQHFIGVLEDIEKRCNEKVARSAEERRARRAASQERVPQRAESTCLSRRQVSVSNQFALLTAHGDARRKETEEAIEAIEADQRRRESDSQPTTVSPTAQSTNSDSSTSELKDLLNAFAGLLRRHGQAQKQLIAGLKLEDMSMLTHYHVFCRGFRIDSHFVDEIRKSLRPFTLSIFYLRLLANGDLTVEGTRWRYMFPESSRGVADTAECVRVAADLSAEDLAAEKWRAHLRWLLDDETEEAHRARFSVAETKGDPTPTLSSQMHSSEVMSSLVRDLIHLASELKEAALTRNAARHQFETFVSCVQEDDTQEESWFCSAVSVELLLQSDLAKRHRLLTEALKESKEQAAEMKREETRATAIRAEFSREFSDEEHRLFNESKELMCLLRALPASGAVRRVQKDLEAHATEFEQNAQIYADKSASAEKELHDAERARREDLRKKLRDNHPRHRGR
jgi:hypothetical protein